MTAPVNAATTNPPSATVLCERIARVCHETNRAYCVTQGDFSHKPWDDAPQWQRVSAIAGVEHAIANPNATPEGMHLNWMADKIAAGWRYGPEKDPVRLTHPCLMPYEKLPEMQRMKDKLFLAVVRTLVEGP